jgi:hypothetical protein
MVWKAGPSGGIGGENPCDTATKPAQDLVGIAVYYGDAIVDVFLKWADKSVTGIGGVDSYPGSFSVDLTTPPRTVIRISGFIGWWNNATVVTGIQFDFSDGSNSGLLGKSGFLPFEYDLPPGQGLVGFFGYTTAVIDQIGFKFDALPG